MLTKEEKKTKRPYIEKMLMNNQIYFSDTRSYENCVKMLIDASYTAHFGVATTGELLEELTARSNLNYSPIKGEPEPQQYQHAQAEPPTEAPSSTSDLTDEEFDRQKAEMIPCVQYTGRNNDEVSELFGIGLSTSFKEGILKIHYKNGCTSKVAVGQFLIKPDGQVYIANSLAEAVELYNRHKAQSPAFEDTVTAYNLDKVKQYEEIKSYLTFKGYKIPDEPLVASIVGIVRQLEKYKTENPEIDFRPNPSYGTDFHQEG